MKDIMLLYLRQTYNFKFCMFKASKLRIKNYTYFKNLYKPSNLAENKNYKDIYLEQDIGLLAFR